MFLPPVVMRGTCVGSQGWATRFLYSFFLLVASRAINLTEEVRENPRVMVLRPTNRLKHTGACTCHAGKAGG